MISYSYRLFPKIYSRIPVLVIVSELASMSLIIAYNCIDMLKGMLML